MQHAQRWTLPLTVLVLLVHLGRAPGADAIDADLLVVGGTESGCAAAVQAARMGVQRVVLVNDIEWLGGQFSAEALGAIDENRAHGYNGEVPIPRSGIFRDVIDAIETENAARYNGVRRPGNTRVITTARPIVSEAVFRALLAPFEAAGQIVRYSNYRVRSVLTEADRVVGVEFDSTRDASPLTVRARLTIDASDWGDVIRASGAGWDAGIDARSEFDEPSAPPTAEPATDLNPITWCLILVEQDRETLLPKPAGYDPRSFRGRWGWIDGEFAYSTRRLVDGHGFAEIDHPDVLLINNPNVDYPLDTFPADVASALEATASGTAQRSLVEMTSQQRDIVFRDAKLRSLSYFYFLQEQFPKFRRMALSDEFGTPDRLPPKPYIRESLRLAAQHVIREPEVLGFEGRANYATTMFPDAVCCWQFELDFHPTRRAWLTDEGNKGAWEADFRGNRRFGRGGTGRAVFPLRALVPRDVHGLLGAQKNLGYTSIVSSSCRLHDQSIHVGQASGAVAAVCLRHEMSPAELYLRPARLADIWNGLLNIEAAAPLAIWPFSDVDPFDPGFVAIQQLALRRLLNLDQFDTAFRPDEPATPDWLHDVAVDVRAAGYELPAEQVLMLPATRRNAALAIWRQLAQQPTPDVQRATPDDADGDGLLDEVDPLPFTLGTVSWKPSPLRDGLPSRAPPFDQRIRAFRFATANADSLPGFALDFGEAYSDRVGYGWLRDLKANTRLRQSDAEPLRDGFVFTREQDTWECRVVNGTWTVHICLGDAAHDQPGQFLQIEGVSVANSIDTAAGSFREFEAEVDVGDERLTVTLGTPNGGSNTCINWLLAIPQP